MKAKKEKANLGDFSAKIFLAGIAAVTIGYLGYNWKASDQMTESYTPPQAVYAAEKRKFIQETKKEDKKQSLETALQIFSNRYTEGLKNGNIDNSASELIEIRNSYSANTEPLYIKTKDIAVEFFKKFNDVYEEYSKNKIKYEVFISECNLLSRKAKNKFDEIFKEISPQKERKPSTKKKPKKISLNGMMAPLAHPFLDYFKEASKKYGISEQTLLAIADAESDFKADAVSPKGAYGIMQVMPGTYQIISKSYEDFPSWHKAKSSPRDLIMAGAVYYRDMVKKYNSDRTLALAAYNLGPGIVDEEIKKYGKEGFLKRLQKEYPTVWKYIQDVQNGRTKYSKNGS